MRLRLIRFVTGAHLVCASAFAWAGEAYETPVPMRAADLAPKGIPLKGECYAVDPVAQTDGLLVTFTIRSDFGRIEARGPGMLHMRIVEVDALKRLTAMKSTDVFIDSVAKSATALGHAVVGVVTNPVETVKAIPAGIGRFFKRTARQIKTATQNIGDVQNDRAPGAPRGSEAQAQTQNVAVAAGSAAGRATRDFFGYDEKRRDLARQLRVDPYTTNPILKKELDDVAWTAFAGGLGIDILTTKVPGGRVVQATSTLTDWIYETPPGDLKVRIEASLRKMGVDQETIDLFLRHRFNTLTTQTALVLALEKMEGVYGRADVLESAVTLDTEDQVLYLATGMGMLARQHAATPLVKIVDGRPIGFTRAGRIVVAAPVDYVFWTEEVAAFAHRDDLQPYRPKVIMPGRLSDRARSEFKKSGWEIEEGVPLVSFSGSRTTPP